MLKLLGLDRPKCRKCRRRNQFLTDGMCFSCELRIRHEAASWIGQVHIYRTMHPDVYKFIHTLIEQLPEGITKTMYWCALNQLADSYLQPERIGD